MTTDVKSAIDKASREEVRTGVSWRYLDTGAVTHAIGPGAMRDAAACGLGGWPSEWLGTGNQQEYERAATLPKCRLCLRKLPVSLGGERSEQGWPTRK
jgi:hypothetical protein